MNCLRLTRRPISTRSKVQPLAADVTLQPATQQAAPIDSVQIVALAKAQLKLAEIQLKSVQAQIANDNATFKGEQEEASLAAAAQAAGRLQLQVQLAQAEADLLKANAAKRAAAVKKRDQAKAALGSSELPTPAPCGAASKPSIKENTRHPSIHLSTPRRVPGGGPHWPSGSRIVTTR